MPMSIAAMMIGILLFYGLHHASRKRYQLGLRIMVSLLIGVG